MSDYSDGILDVAIVGGGVAGVYAGWRLLGSEAQASAQVQHLAAGRQLRVAVFEASDRIGGRLLSVTPPGMPHVPCELGGMRYISNQPLCRSLVEDVLRLRTHELLSSQPTNICYLRGRRMRFSDLTNTAMLPYSLEGCEIGLDPGSLLLLALQQLVPGVDKMSDAEFDDVYRNFTIDGLHLYEAGFWNLLLRVVSGEAYELIQDSSGYYSITTNWNAGDAIRMCLGDFAAGITYRGFTDGFETVPRELSARFQKAGGAVLLGHRLVGFDTASLPDGEAGVKLAIARADGQLAAVFARNLVLAMPRRSLQLLARTGPLFSPEQSAVNELVNSVEGIPLFKIFVAYHAPWWQAVGASTGRATTTLPLRQCYYWGVEGDQPGADAKNRNAVLLASYEDVRETFFWSALEKAAKQAAKPYALRANRFVAPAAAAAEPWSRYQAPHLMVDEVHRQLMMLHGVRYAPEPYAAAYYDWQQDPYGGGVHFWNIGYNSLDTIPRMVRPRPDVPVFVIGEAYSRTQGWVEGALETSELMLQQHFGLAPPSWVTPPAAQPTSSTGTTTAATPPPPQPVHAQ